MSWLSELAGKAENLLNNLDEQTGAALRNHVIKPRKSDLKEFPTHPEPVWNQRRKPVPRALRRVTEPKYGYPPQRKTSPVSSASTRDTTNPPRKLNRGSSTPRRQTCPHYNLQNCPKTAVGDADEKGGLKNSRPRFSLPREFEPASVQHLFQEMEDLEVENAMLKSERDATNTEVSDLLSKLHHTEEGEDVVSCSEELKKSNAKLERTEVFIRQASVEKNALRTEMEQLKTEVKNLNNVDIDQRQNYEKEIDKLKERNKDLEELVKLLNQKSKDNETVIAKGENDLRHAHNAINVLQNDLQKSNEECKRLEKEWEAYKHRVKTMLAAKDKEIKALKQGVQFTEDTKILVDQIENLKHERDNILSEAVTRVRVECEDLKKYVETLEGRHNNAERVIVALRDALKDERAARTRAEAQCNGLAKELKCMQIETVQTIANLRNALSDKDNDLQRVKDSMTTTSSHSIDTATSSALNVADYDVRRHSEDNEKVFQLTQKLVQRQAKIDSLLAENHVMKIQLDKLESKHTSEKSNPHSVVQLQDRHHSRSTSTAALYPTWSKARLKLGMLVRRFPLFRIFVFTYMICLHLLVVTVLLSNTPDLSKPQKHNSYHLAEVFN